MTDSSDDGYWDSLLKDVEQVEPHPPAPPPRPEPPAAPAPQVPAAASPDAAWQWAQEVFSRDETVEGLVTAFNRGGLLVKVGELAGFVPASHMVGLTRWTNEQDRVTQLSTRIGEKLRLKVIELDPAQNRFILSERLALGRQRDGETLLQTLKVGQVCAGRVNHITDFGAFVDLGGIDGLIHVSELSWERVNHPRDVLRAGQEVQVSVLSIDVSKRRIQLSLKRLRSDPWGAAAHKYQVGQIVEGVITNVTDFGAFAKVAEGLEGLIHVSELSEGSFFHPRNVVQKGDRVQARVLAIDSQRHRLALTLRIGAKPL
ncbi:MAG: S1 RNA-binding domain-containing protein [Chloroflexi bacterium]|nr:S1 RNA-binding domain-containing protein [Chloroflexota bacterium]